MPNNTFMSSVEVFALMDELENNDHAETTESADGNLVVCERCGQLVPEGHLHTVTTAEGETQEWCDECSEYWAVECEHCGELVSVEYTRVVIDSSGDEVDWCESCIGQHAHECAHCGGLCESTEGVWTYSGTWDCNEEQWCRSCVENDARECDECHELIAESSINSYRVYDRGWLDLCPTCVDEHYSRCDRCDRLVHEDDVVWDDCDDPYCPDCINEMRHNTISGYHHTAGNYIIMEDGSLLAMRDATEEQRKGLYLGIELEVDRLDDRYELAQYIRDHYGKRFECKNDGSLTSDGMEIVSQPCTPEWALGDALEDIAERAKEMGGLSNNTDTCGFHIHMNRAYFRDKDVVYRMDRMFHRFSEQMVKFSRRFGSQMHWCEIKGDRSLGEIPDIDERKAAYWDRKKYEGRYEALNDTNANTVEIRLWRGSLNVETIRATIQFTTGLAIVCNTMSDELAEKLTWTQLKLMVRYALEGAGLSHSEFDSYIARREL